MSAYLAKLKQLEGGKNSHYAPDSELTKPTKVPFGSFGGMGAGRIEKKIIPAARLVAFGDDRGVS